VPFFNIEYLQFKTINIKKEENYIKNIFRKNKIVKIYDAAPNDHEMINNPKVKLKANYAFEWEDCSDKLNGALLEDHPYIRGEVIESLKSINVI
jgi:hypothetical protein